MRKKQDNIKICIACSTGGHLVEVKQLAPVYEKYDHFYFTFNGGVAEELKKNNKVRSIPNIVRQNPLTWLTGMILSAYIALLERPDIVITTGAGIVVFLCVFAKLLGAKIIFIESMARVEKSTLTARMLYPFTDLFLVQWHELLKVFPRAKFVGRLF